MSSRPRFLLCFLVVASSAVACSTSIKLENVGGAGSTSGSGGTISTSSDEPFTSASSGLGSLTGAGGEGGAGNIGTVCSSDADCDPTQLNEFCAGVSAYYPDSGLNLPNPLNPTPVCMAFRGLDDCSAGTGKVISACNHGAGICAFSWEVGTSDCLAACTFDDTASAPTGCPGKDLCHVAAFIQNEVSGAAEGVGYCMGGCSSDADCNASKSKCDPYSLECYDPSNIYSPTQALGTSCSPNPDHAKDCLCNADFDTVAGECSQTCLMGETNTCPSGFECDAALPTSGDVVFTKAPVGLAGWCMLDCSQDGDCPNGYCAQSAGTESKTCHVGKKP